MKKATKASSFWSAARELLLCSIFLLLSACADSETLSYLTGEPGKSVTEAPRTVGRPSNYKSAGWPNLADVPDRPTNFVPQSEWTEIQGELVDDKVDALITKARMEATAPEFEPSSSPTGTAR